MSALYKKVLTGGVSKGYCERNFKGERRLILRCVKEKSKKLHGHNFTGADLGEMS